MTGLVWSSVFRLSECTADYDDQSIQGKAPWHSPASSATPPGPMEAVTANKHRLKLLVADIIISLFWGEVMREKGAGMELLVYVSSQPPYEDINGVICD